MYFTIASNYVENIYKTVDLIKQYYCRKYFKLMINLFIMNILDENYNVGAHIVIRMQIKPRNVSGLLIAVHSNSKKDFLMLRLDNGSLNFTIENGNRPRSAIFTPTSPSFFINGEWHDITGRYYF